MKRFLTFLAILLLSFFGVLALSSSTFAQAGFNEEVSYQGKLLNGSGQAVPDDTYDMTFRLYTQATSGSAVWTETYSSGSAVSVQSGLFSVMLGSSTSLSGIDFNQNLWLSVEVENDGEMTPRKKLGAVPAAFQASELDGLDSTQFLRSDAADTMSATSSSPLLSLVQNGTGDILSVFSGVTPVLTVLNNGTLRIGDPFGSFLDITEQKIHSTKGSFRIQGAGGPTGGDLTIAGGAGSGFGGVSGYDVLIVPGSANGGPSDGNIILAHDGTSIIGNVGIGTSAPASLLDVAGLVNVDALAIADAYTFPTADGTTGQVLTTDGSGQLSFSSISTGATTTASNLGTGAGLFAQRNGSDLQFKSLIAGANVSISASTSAITISATDTNTEKTQEEIEDFTGGLLTAGPNITLTYNDASSTLEIEASSTAPGGPSGAIQFNDGGVFTGTSTFVWDATNNALAIGTDTPFTTGSSTAALSLTGGDFVQKITEAPKLVGSATVYDGAFSDLTGLAVSGDYAYVGSDYKPLKVLDISDPNNPKVIATSTGAHVTCSQDIDLSGSYLYVANYCIDGVVVLDISDPNNPTEVGFVTSTDLDGAFSIIVAGKYAYVASYKANSFTVVDISDPANPIQVGTLSTPNLGFAADSSGSVDISESFAYVASSDTDSLMVIDISDSSNPTEVGSISTTNLGYAISVAVSGSYAYVTGESGDLTVIDVSDPLNLTEIGHTKAPTEASNYSIYALSSITVSGSYAYAVASAERNALIIFDISDPTNPVKITEQAFYTEDGSYYFGNVAIQGSYAYVIPYTSGVLYNNIGDFYVLKLPTTRVPTLVAGTAKIDQLDVSQSIDLTGSLSVGIGLNVGGSSFIGGDFAVHGFSTLLGNVGIGTTSPLAKLTVQSDGVATSSALAILNASSTNLFTVLDNGNVGIGTTTPASTLTVAGSGYFTGGLTTLGTTTVGALTLGTDTITDLTGTGLTVSSGALTIATSTLGLGNGTYLGLTDTPSSFTASAIPFVNTGASALSFNTNFVFDGTNLGIGTSNPFAALTIKADGNGTSSALSIQNATGTNLLTVLENGNVGVGTSTPQSKLHVDGAVELEGEFVQHGTSTNKQLIYLRDDDGDPLFVEQTAYWVSNMWRSTYGLGIGKNALQYNTGFGAYGFGQNALQYNTGYKVSGFGSAALQNNTGYYSSGFGNASLQNNTGKSASGFGFKALRHNTGSFASGFGASSLERNTGKYASGFGTAALQYNTGSSTSGFGYSALRYNEADRNTALGAYAGVSSSAQWFNNDVDGLLGSDNTFLGANTSYDWTNRTLTNSTAVGANVLLKQSNSVILGNDADVGIGTSTPTARLSIVGTSTDTLLKLFTSGGSEVFTVTGSGNVGIGTTTPSSALTVAGSGYFTGGLTALGTTTVGALTLGTDTITNLTGSGLTVTSGALSIATSTLGLGNGTFLGLTDTPSSFTASAIPFVNTGASALSFNPNFVFDGTNLGIGTSSPNARLTVAGDINIAEPSSGLSFMGTRMFYASTTAHNIAIGENAGEAFVSYTDGVIAIGYEAGGNATSSVTFGEWNNYIGYQAGYSSDGEKNNIIGIFAGMNNLGNGNNFMGRSAGENNDGLRNNMIGYKAGMNSSGDWNNLFGVWAGAGNIGSDNNLIGGHAGEENIGDSNNIFGEYAGNENTGDSNNIFGTYAGWSNAGSYNNIFGNSAGVNNTGSYTGFFGYYTGARMSASRTVAIGATALFGASSGGPFDGNAATTTNNVAIGYGAGHDAQTGADNNILIGYQAADDITTGHNNIVLGYDIDLPTPASNNTLNIGNLIFGTGLTATGTTLSTGNVGIGTTTPSSTLTVAGSGYFTGGLTALGTGTFGGLTIAGAYTFPTADGTTGQVLTTDGAGNLTFTTLTDTNATSTGPSGALQFADGSGNFLADSANLFWDDVNNRLGIGTSTPQEKLTVNGGGLLVTGNYTGSSTVTNVGTGAMMFFDPGKGAFRAGRVTGDQWDSANVGAYSAAFGNGTTASGTASTAFGGLTAASGFASTAFGQNTSASEDYSTAFGRLTTASGLSSVAFGFLTEASEVRSTAFGSQTAASGFVSTAFGSQTAASGLGSTAFGAGTNASGTASTAFGFNTTAQSYAATVLGRYNIASGSSTTWIATDPLFAIGNGSSASSTSNALTVLKNGKIGLGTTTPQSTLTVVGDGWFGGALTTTGTTTVGALAVVGTATSTFAGDISIAGSIVPTADNTYSLGTASSTWQDVYIGPGSLYINGQKVLGESTSGSIVVSADPDQTLSLKTEGAGDIVLQPMGTGIIDLKGNVQLNGAMSITSSDNAPVAFGDGVLAGNLAISGNTISVENTNGGIYLTPNGTGGTFVTSGNFGIGTTTASSRLTVDGDGWFGGNVTVSGTATVDSLVVGGAYTLPGTDGTTGQALVTDGNGNLSFATISGTGSSTAYLAGTGLDLTGTTFSIENTVLQTTDIDTETKFESALFPVLTPGEVSGSGTTTFLGLTDTPSSFTASAIPFVNTGASALAFNGNFVFDGTNLGIGTSSPSSMLDVAGTGHFGGLLTLDAGLNIGSETFTSLTGTGLALSGGALTTTLGTAIDISLETNLTAGTGTTLTDDTLSVDLGTNIDGDEIVDGTVSISADTNLIPFSGLTLMVTPLGGDRLLVNLGNKIENSEVIADTLDWDSLADSMTLDASTTIAQGGKSFTFTGGNVGIGTTTASSRLTVDGDGWFGGSLDVTGTTTVGSLTLGGESFTSLTGTGLTLSSGSLATTLGTAIDTTEITDGTIQGLDFETTNTAGEDNILSYDATTGGFTWVTDQTGTAGVTTYLGLSDTPSSFTASAIPFVNSGASALVFNGNFVFDGTMLGIGTSNPTALLSVSADGVNPAFRVESSTSSLYALEVDAQDKVTVGTGYGDIFFDLSGGTQVGIGTSTPGSALEVVGTIRQSAAVSCSLTADANGDIVCTPSDETFKNKVADVTGALGLVEQLNPIYFTWKNNARWGSQEEIGLLAQEVNKVVPQVITHTGDYYSLDYSKLTALNIAAIQELNMKLEAFTGTTSSSTIAILNEEQQDSIIENIIDEVTGFMYGVGEQVTGFFDGLFASEVTIVKEKDKEDQSVGAGKIDQEEDSVTIENNLVEKDSRILVTFTDPLKGRSFYVEKDDGEFTVHLSEPLPEEEDENDDGEIGEDEKVDPVHFDYLIIGVTTVDKVKEMKEDLEESQYGASSSDETNDGGGSGSTSEGDTNPTDTGGSDNSSGNDGGSSNASSTGETATSTDETATSTDTVAPVITLNGNKSVEFFVGETYTEPGAEASDDVDGNITDKIAITESVDTSTAGEYTVTYTVSDTAGNTATKTRTVTVSEPQSTNPPEDNSAGGTNATSTDDNTTNATSTDSGT